ncbi:MAG: Rrf2 family transcriptional regulator [Christensenellaceae bacterium]|jgi:Rrf2 family protein|nr:Rrf2 family transcriptional regulator [Christensenellaceae bacterium]
MRISAKGRYALAAMIEIARQTKDGEIISVINISGTLGISKIYLEQVLSQLKKGGIINALKGSKGGYQLARDPGTISAMDVLLTVENTLIESAGSTVEEQAPAVEMALKEKVFQPLDRAVRVCLSGITIADLLEYTDQQNADQSFMMNM